MLRCMAAIEGRGLRRAMPSITCTSSAGSLRCPRIGALSSCQPNQPGGAVSGKPTLRRADRDTCSPCHLRQRDTLVDVRPEHRKACHGLLALFLGESGQSRCHVLLLIQDAHCTSPPGQRCPQEDRRTDRPWLTFTSRQNLAATSLMEMVRYFLH